MQNHKTRRSRTELKQALLTLMKTKNYSKITIKELCEAAGLNRSTFYANYVDIQALLLDIHNDIFDGMSESLQENLPLPPTEAMTPTEAMIPTKAMFPNKIMENRIESVTQIITYLEEHLDIFHLLFTNNDDNLFERHMSSYYLEKYCGKNASREESYLLLYHAIGSFALIHKWIVDKCPCPPRELAELICRQSENVRPPK